MCTYLQSHEQRSKLVLKAKVAHSTEDSPAKYHEQVSRSPHPTRVTSVLLVLFHDPLLYNALVHLERCSLLTSLRSGLW